MGGAGPRWFWGAGLAAGLVGAACLSVALGLLPGIPLFDGLAPPPLYRWVNPPPVLSGENLPPSSATVSVALSPSGSEAGEGGTDDGQVYLTVPAGAFPPQPGQSAVSITVRPADPTAVPAPPPGVVIQGNAYRIDAVYVPSGTTATAVQQVLVQLAYPVDATQVILNPGSGWQFPETIPESASLQLEAPTMQFGIFAAALTGVAPTRPPRLPPWAYGVAGLALIVAAVPTLIRRRAP
jgi:hypothetical protein